MKITYNNLDPKLLLDNLKIFLRGYSNLLKIVNDFEADYLKKYKNIDLRFFKQLLLKYPTEKKLIIIIDFLNDELYHKEKIDYNFILEKFIFNMENQIKYSNLNIKNKKDIVINNYLKIINHTKKLRLEYKTLNKYRFEALKNDFYKYIENNNFEKFSKIAAKSFFREFSNEEENKDIVHLFKFMKFEHLKDLVKTKKLYLVKHNQWEDKNEMYFNLKIKEYKNFKLLFNYIYKNFKVSYLLKYKNLSLCDIDYLQNFVLSKLFDILFFMNYSKSQSWTSTFEDNGKWNSYSGEYIQDKNSMVKICIKKDFINNHDSLSYTKIKYIDVFDIKERVNNIFEFDENANFTNNFKQIIGYKDILFENEYEYRVFYNLSTNDKIYNIHKQEFINQFNSFLNNFNYDILDVVKDESLLKNLYEHFIVYSNRMDRDAPKFLKVDLNSKVEDFIKFVTVTPYADVQTINEIENFCKENNINYLGKSVINNIR
ncbi:hypothetical protein WG909_13105 [Peptostreptococcaceae bacterium AGR-M142]